MGSVVAWPGWDGKEIDAPDGAAVFVSPPLGSIGLRRGYFLNRRRDWVSAYICTRWGLFDSGPCSSVRPVSVGRIWFYQCRRSNRPGNSQASGPAHGKTLWREVRTCIRRRDNDLRRKDRGGINGQIGLPVWCRVIFRPAGCFEGAKWLI